MAKQGWVALIGTQISVVLLFVAVFAVLNRPVPQPQNATTLVKGDTGAQGPIGPQGPAGVAGQMGMMGPQGVQGEPGLPGPQGEKGDTGQQGAKGDPGTPFQFPEQRENPDTGKTEWRCTGDTIWTTLASSPITGESCL